MWWPEKFLPIFGLSLSLAVSAQAPTTDLVLGQSGVFTGVSSELGTDLWKGANAYFAYINSQGGVNGRRIKVITKDDGFEGKKSLINTIDFVKNKNVFALFDYMGSQAISDSLPAIQKFSKDHIFLFGNFTGAQPQREKPYSSHVFNIRASYWQETQGLVDQLYKMGKRRFGLFIQYDGYGRAGANGVRKTLKEKNLEVVAQTNYQRGAPFEESMQMQAGTLIKAQADVIISVGSYAASAAFIRDARNAGFKGPIVDLSGVGADTLLDMLMAEGKKVHRDYTYKLINSQIVPPPTDISYPLVKEYQEVMKKYSVSYPGDANDDPKSLSSTTLEGYLNAKVFVEILKRIKGEVTRESFYKTAKETTNLDIGLGPDTVNFNNSSSQALNAVYFTTIEKGSYIVIKDWSKLK